MHIQELRAFAMTRKFYSAKTYKYVRKSFDLGFTHPSVVSSWYNIRDAEPGFTKEALTTLQAGDFYTQACPVGW